MNTPEKKAPLEGLSIDQIEELADKLYPSNYVKDSTELVSLRGLKIDGDERLWWNCSPRFKLEINISTTREQVQSFLDSIPGEFEIFFFDHFHPQLSDPGAYVTAQRFENAFLYKLGNHGWSSEWKEISVTDLGEYLFKNREYNTGELKLWRIFEVAQKGAR